MKTKAIFQKIFTVLILVAFATSFGFTQGDSDVAFSSYLSKKSSTNLNQVNYENQSDIKDWMIDEMAFTNSAESAHIERWMVSHDDGMDELFDVYYYNTNWLFESEDLPNLYLADWMVEDQPSIVYSFHQYFQEVDVMQWMINCEQFVYEQEQDAIVLQNWMLETDGIEYSIENDKALDNWMLDQKYWY